MLRLRRAALVVGVVCALIGGGAFGAEVGAQPGQAVVVPADSSLAPAALGAPSTLVPITPARIVDTRSGLGGVLGPIASDTTVDFQVVGVEGVPAEATSVVLNVTAVDPVATGFLTVFASGTTRPDASNLNVVAGRNVANLVIARVGANGKVSLYDFGGTVHVIFDVTAYFVNGTGAARFHGVTPQRLLDTRVTRSGVVVTGIPAPGTTIGATVSTQSPAELHWTALLVNITATAPQADGFLTVYPSGQARPPSSNLNFKAGQTVANAAIIKLGQLSSGTAAINVYNALASTHIIIDLMGIFDDGTIPPNFSNPTAYRALDQPVRAYNTRVTSGPFGPQETRFINISGAGGAPSGALGAVFNATATATTSDSFLTIWPPILPQPTVSSLNWAAGDTVPNFVGVFIASGGPNAGQVAIYNDAGTTDVLLDITGYFYPV